MDDTLLRRLTINDIKVLNGKIVEINPEYDLGDILSDGKLEGASTADLIAVKRDMRDMLRSLGGAR